MPYIFGRYTGEPTRAVREIITHSHGTGAVPDHTACAIPEKGKEVIDAGQFRAATWLRRCKTCLRKVSPMARRDHESDIRRLSREYRMAEQALGIRLLDIEGELPAALQSDIEALRSIRARLDEAKAKYAEVYG